MRGPARARALLLIPLVLLLGTPSARAQDVGEPPPDNEHYQLLAELGVEYDSNAHRVEKVAGRTGAIVGSFLQRLVLSAFQTGRLELPVGMTSGLYKYVVFDEIEKSTGRVYEEPCHRIMGRADDLPNTDWVAENHWCVPLYYRPESRAAALGEEEP